MENNKLSLSVHEGIKGGAELIREKASSAPVDHKMYILAIIVGIVAGILICVVVMGLLEKRKKGKQASAVKDGGAVTPLPDAGAAPGVPAVGKLHERGAREGQQDSFFVSGEDMYETHGLLAVVADGMGGLADGDKVSQIAATAMMNGFYEAQGHPEQILPVLLSQAQKAVMDFLQPLGNVRKSGSTMVAGLIRSGYFYYLSVGDSRICLYRGGSLVQLNREHVYANDLTVQAVNLEKAFSEAQTHPKAAGLTSFLGMGRLEMVDLPAQPVKILPGDRFILMSDGVYNALSEEEMSAALAMEPQDAAKQLGEMIREKAYQNQDNYTAVIIKC